MLVRSLPFYDRPQIRAVGAGAINSLFGFGVITIALLLGASSLNANALGFSAGWVMSFFLYRRFVFNSLKRDLSRQALSFALAAALAYCANLAVLLVVERWLGLPPLLAQFFAVGAYSLTLFLISGKFVFGNGTVRIPHKHLALLSTTILSALFVFLIVAQVRLTHDVVWQFWIARQLAGGATLYTEIVEINPPLWFWMALGIHHLADILNLTATSVLKAVVVLFGLSSVLLVDSFAVSKNLSSRVIISITTLLAILLLPIYDFGQREHLALIAALPYCSLIGARLRKENVTILKAVAIGLIASAGFALKHYFAVVPILLEMLLIFVLKRNYQAFRPETFILVLCAVLYFSAIMVFTPEFVSQMVPMIRLAYGGYENPLIFQLLGWHQIIIYILLVTIWLERDRFNFRTPNVASYLVASGGFYLAYFAQQKGWQYHAIPVAALLFVALIALMVEAIERRPPLRGFFVGGVALTSVIVISGSYIGTYRSGGEDAFEFAARDLSSGETIFIVSTGPRFAWPMIEERGLRWPSRYFAMWTTAATEIPQEERLSGKLKVIANEIRLNTLYDLSCNPPDVIAIENPVRNARLSAIDFSYMDYLRENPQLARFLDNYEYGGSGGGVDRYTLSNKHELPPKPRGCRNLH
jgi:putative flippase GtrA